MVFCPAPHAMFCCCPTAEHLFHKQILIQIITQFKRSHLWVAIIGSISSQYFVCFILFSISNLRWKLLIQLVSHSNDCWQKNGVINISKNCLLGVELTIKLSNSHVNCKFNLTVAITMWWKLHFSERKRSSEWKTHWERQEPCTRTLAASIKDFFSGKGLGQSTGEVCQHRAGGQRNMEDKDWKVEWR